jgi:phosphoglycolate phosphatase
MNGGFGLWDIFRIAEKDKKMKYKAIFFDLDGTLVNTLDDLSEAMNGALAALGQPGRSRDECREMIGRGLGEFARAALPADGGHLLEALLRKMREIYAGICLNKTVPYAGMCQVLSACKKAGVRTAVISNKAHAMTVRIAEHYFGRDTFDEILGQKEGMKCKPDPEPMRFLLDKMSLKAEEVLYVGDSDVDAETARNAGVDFVAAGWGFRSAEQLRKAGAKKIIDRPVELLDWF